MNNISKLTTKLSTSQQPRNFLFNKRNTLESTNIGDHTKFLSSKPNQTLYFPQTYRAQISLASYNSNSINTTLPNANVSNKSNTLSNNASNNSSNINNLNKLIF